MLVSTCEHLTINHQLIELSKFIYKTVLLIVILSVTSSCKNSSDLNESEFKTLMNNVAEGWSTQDTELAIGSFDTDAIYMEPPNIQYYRGHNQLIPYFDELTEEHRMVFHHLWFDVKTQTGVGEYTFSYGKETADTGVVIVEISNRKIKFWREYQRKGPINLKDYLRTDNKKWEWHIGNYP